MTIAIREFAGAPLDYREKFISDRAFYYRAVEKGFKKDLFSRSERDFLRKEISLWFRHRNGPNGFLHYPIKFFAKALRLSERTARRIRKWCIEHGFVKVVGYARGGRSRAVHYVLDLDAISHFVEPPPIVFDGDLHDIGGCDRSDVDSADFDEYGTPVQSACDMAPDGYFEGEKEVWNFADKKPSFPFETNEYRSVLSDEKPCQNGRRYKRAERDNVSSHGSCSQPRHVQSNATLNSLIGLLGLQGLITVISGSPPKQAQRHLSPASHDPYQHPHPVHGEGVHA